MNDTVTPTMAMLALRTYGSTRGCEHPGASLIRNESVNLFECGMCGLAITDEMIAYLWEENKPRAEMKP